MFNHKLRKCLTGAATAGAALTMAMAFAAAPAGAAPTDPPGGAIPVYPHFYNGAVEQIRSAGSDTTFFMMQQVSDLYSSAGLYGCTLDSATGQNLYVGGTSSSSNLEAECQANANVATTDVSDNWDRTEVATGVDNVGSSAGQAELCNEADGTAIPNIPSGFSVDFARSSKPSDNLTGCAEQETGYAKDGVDPVAFPDIIPGNVGAATFSTYKNVNGGTGLIGPVAAGWLPGDALSGPYTGQAFTEVDNEVGGVVSQSSVAYDLWCATGTARITDWGQLTNLGPNFVADQVTTSTSSTTISLPAGEVFASAIGSGDTLSSSNVSGLSGLTVTSNNGNSLTLSGDPGTSTTTGTITISTGGSAVATGSGQEIGIPIRIIGVNTSSGTESTWQKYANSGPTSSGGCSANADPNAAQDPNPATDTGDYAGNQYLLENNVSNIGTYQAAYFTTGSTTDWADTAVLDASSLYYASNGVLNTNPYASAVIINGTSYTAIKLTLDNGVAASTPTLLNNSYGAARTLFNIVSQNTVRAPTAGFLNWLCDGNANFTKAQDPSTGTPYNTELSTIITGTFGFARLTDQTSTTPAANPADGQPAPNNTCDASEAVTTSSGSPTVTLTAGGSFPAAITSGESITGTGIPAGTTVTTNGGTTLTLSKNATASGAVTVQFPNAPPVLSYVLP